MRVLLPLTTAALLGCTSRTPPESTSSHDAEPSATPTASVPAMETSAPESTGAPSSEPASVPSTAASQLPPPNAPFVRGDSYTDPVNACVPSGGIAFSCRIAYDEEKDPVRKRYLRRVASGYAAGVRDYSSKHPKMAQGNLPHAEVPYMCDLKKPCNEHRKSDVHNGALTCLALTVDAVQRHEPALARAAHAYECKCHPTTDFIGYNTTAFICDGNGKPAFLAPKMSATEAANILACGKCDAKKGPAACKAEIALLAKTDPPLAEFVRAVQVPLCQTKPEP